MRSSTSSEAGTGSGRFSTRMSPGPWNTSARMGASLRTIFYLDVYTSTQPHWR
jgi:hypothetical protein